MKKGRLDAAEDVSGLTLRDIDSDAVVRQLGTSMALPALRETIQDEISRRVASSELASMMRSRVARRRYLAETTALPVPEPVRLVAAGVAD